MRWTKPRGDGEKHQKQKGGEERLQHLRTRSSNALMQTSRKRNAWCSNQTSAEATYGHISEWDTSAVTDMSQLFMSKKDFNDDISKWNVDHCRYCK